MATSQRSTVRTNHRRSNHGTYYDQRVAKKIVVTEHVEDYRAAVRNLVNNDDIALEVGCHSGVTTSILGKYARLTYGVDKTISPIRMEEQKQFVNDRVRFRQMDANDIGGLQKLSKEAAEAVYGKDQQGKHAGFSVILIDISGNVTLNNLLTVLERYESSSVFPSLRLIIVKSFRFASLMDRSRIFEEAQNTAATAAVTTTSQKKVWAIATLSLVSGVILGTFLARR